MILKAIIAVFFSLLIQPTLMAPYEPIVIRREAEYLMTSLNETCIKLKNTTCGKQKVRAIQLDHTVDLDKEKLCTTVKKVFCQVNTSLKMLDRAICKKNPFRIQGSKFMSRKGKCILPNDRVTVNEFCPKLKDYVQRLYNRC